MSVGANRFFSATDTLGAKRWEPGKLGGGSASRKADGTQAANEADAQTRAREEGYRAGFSTGESTAAALAVRLAAITESARTALAGQDHLLAEGVLDLALDIARQVIRTDLRVRRDDLMHVVREAIDCLPQSTPSPQLILHPNDVDLVRSHIGDEIKLGGWRLVEDHRIEPGGCRVSAANCAIDATLSSRWKRVIASLGREQSWIETENGDPA